MLIQYFKYNAEKKLYYRYQYGKKHMDTANNKQLSFKNIIIQFVDDEPIVKGHPKDYRTINFEKASGKGRDILQMVNPLKSGGKRTKNRLYEIF